MNYCDYNGVDFDTIWDRFIYGVKIVQKTYGHFRSLIDSELGDEDIVDVIKFMIDIEVDNMRDVDYDYAVEIFGEEIVDLLQNDLFGFCWEVTDVIENLTGEIVLIGGGCNECLKEVELELIARNKNVSFNYDLVY